MQKPCGHCGSVLPLESFHRKADAKDGHRSICKACAIKSSLRWYESNRDKASERAKTYFQKRRDELLHASKRWQLQNRDKKLASNAKRRAAHVQAVPSWYGELDEFVYQEAVALRQLRAQMFGFDWHVDHVIPLQGKTVCGFHVHNNFAVIPASENLTKANKAFV